MSELLSRPKRRQSRKGGAAGRRKARLQGPTIHLPTAVRNIPTYELLDREGIERIDDAAMNILETTGIEFRDDRSAQLWQEHGADVDGHRIRIPRALVRRLIRTVPEQFDYHGRNPERSVKVGGNT